MQKLSLPLAQTRAIVFGAVLALAFGGALAAKPDGVGHGNNKKDKQERIADVPVGTYFGAQQRAAASAYYDKQRSAGRCPPGLAKKKNGCMPPGQARKWAMGQPVPIGVVLYPVPQAVVITIGIPPAGYRYVRVANDILLIAIGTRMVVDAIEDLMKP